MTSSIADLERSASEHKQSLTDYETKLGDQTSENTALKEQLEQVQKSGQSHAATVPDTR